MNDLNQQQPILAVPSIKHNTVNMMSRLTSIVVALATFASTTQAIEYVACFGPPSDFEHDGRHVFQTVGLCNQICNALEFPVIAVSNSTDCFCSNALPPLNRVVEESFCNTPCAGYAREMCMNEKHRPR